MPRIAYELKEFRQDFRKADAAVQKRIETFLDRFEQDASSGGMRLKMLSKHADKRIRTARVDDGTRAVLADVGDGEYALLRVMAHDAANSYAETARLDISAVNGLPRLIQMDAAVGTTAATPFAPHNRSLLSHRTDADLLAVGIPHAAVAAVRAYEDRPALMAFSSFLAASDPLIEFAVEFLLDENESVDDILMSLLTLEGATADEERAGDPFAADGAPVRTRPEFDPEDLAAALERPGAGERFRMVEDSAELIEALRGDFAAWRVFLHPLQREAAYEKRYSGPARVSGGAGTGKTVVLLHRAKALLDRASNDDDPPRILVTTFTEHLQRDLRALLESLLGERSADIEVRTVDGLARELHEQMSGSTVAHLHPDVEAALWEELAASHGGERAAVFLRNEYRHVLLARGVRSLEDYLGADRAGRSVRLPATERRRLWPVFEAFEARTRGSRRATTLQLTEDLAALLEAAPMDAYDHVLVDEAQDLHASQWRLLRALVPEGPDDLFIAGDAFQRIYGDTVSLRSVGVETRGRSVRLRRNYRSTHEIIGWGLGVIGKETALDLDEHGADLSGYHSIRSGPFPVTASAPDRAGELESITSTVTAWNASGYAPDEIAVAARQDGELSEIVESLRAAGLRAGPLGRKGRLADQVNVATMGRLKGLEYPCVLVTGLGAENIPSSAGVCPPEVDRAQHDSDLRTERSLVYVAATRARDELALSWVGELSPLLRPATTPPVVPVPNAS